MPYTQSDLDALDAAIVGAELEVQLDGRRVRYRSMDELLQARRHVQEQITLAGSGGRTRFQFRFTGQREG